MTPEQLLENLKATEEALDSATNDIEYVRERVRLQILQWRIQGRAWPWIKATPVWDAYKRLGGS